MATYKVPQDVEADDKLIGPFSFRQFLYLLIVAAAIFIAWALSRIFVGLAIIPLPVIIFFGALALPLRKDQPMEIYMAAMVSYFLKPRQRLWDPDGVETLIEISAPKTVEVQLTKDLSQTEAAKRLSYLADIVDSGGWAIRGVPNMNNSPLNSDVYLEAQSATDILDMNTSVSHTFDEMMHQSTERMRAEAKERMLQATQPPQPTQEMLQPASQPTLQPLPNQYPQPTTTNQPLTNQQPQQPPINYQLPPTTPPPHYNPYPTFHQTVIQPLNDASHRAVSDIAPPTNAYHPETQPAQQEKQEKQPSTSDTALTTGIINLANNPDLSIETIAHEANRLRKKAEQSSDEVVISLR